MQNGIQAEIEFTRSLGGASFLEIFNKRNWRRTLAGCVGICSQWAAGAPIVFGYSTYFVSDMPCMIESDKADAFSLISVPSRQSRHGSLHHLYPHVSWAMVRYGRALLTHTKYSFVLLMVAIFVSLISCEYIGRRPLLVGYVRPA